MSCAPGDAVPPSGVGHGDRGAATIYALALVMVLATSGTAALAVAASVVARHRADSAADMAALSAAGAARDGSDGACAIAAEVAQAQHAVLSDCRFDGQVADITVAVPAPSFGGLLPPARGRARAGPATATAVAGQAAPLAAAGGPVRPAGSRPAGPPLENRAVGSQAGPYGWDAPAADRHRHHRLRRTV